MMRSLLAVLLLLAALPTLAEDLCGTSPAVDERAFALDARASLLRQHRIAKHATAGPTLHDGVFVVHADELNAPGLRPFDLAGTTLVFEPRGEGRYAVRREALQYREPQGERVHQFVRTTAPDWHYVTRTYNGATLYLSAFNGIHDAAPPQLAAEQMDEVEAITSAARVISPLLLTNRKPRNLEFPDLFVEETADALIVTWRSTRGIDFGYDVQAELHRDGTIVFSYRELRKMTWGTPVITQGRAAWRPATTLLGGADDAANDVTSTSTTQPVLSMLDVRRVDVVRLGDSSVLAVRIRLAAPIDVSRIPAGGMVRYYAYFGSPSAGGLVELDIRPDGSRTVWPLGRRSVLNGTSASYSGDTVELLVAQEELPALAESQPVRVYTATSSATPVEQAQATIALGSAAKPVVQDFATMANGTVIEAPFAEAFALPELSPITVWQQLKSQFGLREEDFDAVAVYQAFFTDIIFYAGAYATGGNAQADGIGAGSRLAPKSATVLHMNQLDYNYNSEEKRTSQVILHEFGHRWLYRARIRENGEISRVLAPLTSHPAEYVHTPAAFRVYDENESSTMGGAFWTGEGPNTFRARVANAGYSWTDLYLMGLASPAEVPSWFYLANTNPQLELEYWPDDGAVVTAQRRDVAMSQLTDAMGPRNPTAATSQKQFRALFVLVTEPGVEATPAELTRMTQLRTLFERNFRVATGGRATVQTFFGTPARRRASR